MCCRFQLVAPAEELIDFYDLGFEPAPPRQNIRPCEPITIVRTHPYVFGKRQSSLVLWGFIPAFSKLPDLSRAMFNARSETAWEKPSFRHAAARRRCLIPATAFYEWEHYGKNKIPWSFRVKDEKVFSLGGIWEQWTGPNGEEIDSCAILTTAANPLMKKIHDRMPVIIHPDNYSAWLDSEKCFADDVAALLAPYAADEMSAEPLQNGIPDDKGNAEGDSLFDPKDLL